MVTPIVSEMSARIGHNSAMRHALRYAGPCLALLMLTACDGGGDTAAPMPDRLPAAAPQAAPLTKAASALPTPPPSKPEISNPDPPTTIRVAEDDAASKADSRALATDQRRLPLTRILAIAAKAVPGEVISVELDDDDKDGPEYEIEILTPQGRMIEVKIAGHSGKILNIEED